MNRPTRITLTLLGIAASVGLWSLIATPCGQAPQVEATRKLSDADSPISGVGSTVGIREAIQEYERQQEEARSQKATVKLLKEYKGTP
nr:hypothetical protein [Armatimonas sp.]